MASQGSRLAVVAAVVGNGANVESAIDDVEAAIREVLPHARDIFVALESRG